MSMKGKARITAAEALKDIARVVKIKGRVREWQRAVIRFAKQELPNWSATTAGDLVVLSVKG